MRMAADAVLAFSPPELVFKDVRLGQVVCCLRSCCVLIHVGCLMGDAHTRRHCGHLRRAHDVRCAAAVSRSAARHR